MLIQRPSAEAIELVPLQTGHGAEARCRHLSKGRPRAIVAIAGHIHWRQASGVREISEECVRAIITENLEAYWRAQVHVRQLPCKRNRGWRGGGHSMFRRHDRRMSSSARVHPQTVYEVCHGVSSNFEAIARLWNEARHHILQGSGADQSRNTVSSTGGVVDFNNQDASIDFHGLICAQVFLNHLVSVHWAIQWLRIGRIPTHTDFCVRSLVNNPRSGHMTTARLHRQHR
mmetsp:Transcript_127510/g.238312  ORF Transcript_127510/g.238312 Transcript_127510/m.238312 type:complete len:230 (-) Transcript_127510:8637-9326(-)